MAPRSPNWRHSMNARGKAPRWAHDLADSRLAIRSAGIGAGENGVLAILKSANSRQFDRPPAVGGVVSDEKSRK